MTTRAPFATALRFFVLFPISLLATGCGPVWLLDPPTAEKIAREQNKPLLLYFKAWDSTQHRNMVLQVFNNPAVKAELKTTVNAELEFAFFPDYRKRYGVQQPQVCVMCAPNGEKVDSPLYVNPVPSPEKFLEWLKRAKAEATPPPPTTNQATTQAK